jgi:hypothetical protein
VTRLLLSAAAAQLLRSLVTRTGLGRDRIAVGRFRSVDWQSLTFIGERHEISLRLLGPDAGSALATLRRDLADAEWQLEGHVVADILIIRDCASDDGSILVELEALTLSD